MISTGMAAVYVLFVLMGLVAVVLYLGRLLELRRSHIDWEDFVKGVVNVLDRGNAAEALAICDDNAGPVPNVVSSALRHRGEGAVAVREAAETVARAEKSRLARRLAPLKLLGDIAPMTGLLLTIFGFIRAVTAAQADAVVLRGDLMANAMMALSAAAAGLLVAILVAVMHSTLRARLDRLAVEIDAATSAIILYLVSHGEK